MKILKQTGLIDAFSYIMVATVMIGVVLAALVTADASLHTTLANLLTDFNSELASIASEIDGSSGDAFIAGGTA